jgi:hypothetical protein
LKGTAKSNNHFKSVESFNNSVIGYLTNSIITVLVALLSGSLFISTEQRLTSSTSLSQANSQKSNYAHI